MDRRCLSAWTEAHNSAYPPYVNFSQQPDGAVQVTVRAPAANGVCGGSSTATLPKAEFALLLLAAMRELVP